MAEEATLDRSWDRVEARFGGFPDSQDASESTEASDCDMILIGGAPGLTGESDRAPTGELKDSTRRSDGTGLLRRAASALADGTSGECTRESGGEMGNSGRSSLNFDMVRRGTLDGLRICIGGVTGAVPTK
jgi:hypothetical protein